jgi:mycofactocin system glycosyltransferase
MCDQPPGGCFQLKKGTKLIRSPKGGVILQSNPLRVLKLNQAGFDLLEKCRSGFQPGQQEDRYDFPAETSFLDALHFGGLLDWTPPPARTWPLVSIVIPVYNRPREIEECLVSLQALDYPPEKFEVIVVDDHSRDNTVSVVRRFGVRLVIQPHNQGQSAARNAGVTASRGEIIAFLDSDCTVLPGWLQELVPYFQDSRVALVGGRVDGYYREKRMDLYEQVCSALNMGSVPAIGRGENCVFYVPTCNMLVRKQVYEQAGGLDESLRVGEDVDLCWRLMAARHHLLYIPRGCVLHKHRNHLLSGLLRRFDYGTSEAVLYARVPKVTKLFPWQSAGVGIVLAAVAALATRSWPWMLLMAAILATETGYKRTRLIRKMDIHLSNGEILAASFKGHFQLAYYLAFYLIRYHLLLLVVLSFATPGLIWLWLTLIFFPTTVTYFRKRPRLSWPVFAFFYLSEHIFYQIGAFWGCYNQKSFRLYRIHFKYMGFMPPCRRAGG